MWKLGRILSVLMVFLLMSQAVGLNSVDASPSIPEFGETIKNVELSSELLTELNLTDDLVEPYSIAGAIKVIFEGVVVASLVGGTIKYVTGYSADYWVAKGLSGMEGKLKDAWRFLTTNNLHMNVYVSTFGSITYRCAPDDYACPINSNEDEEEY